MKGKALIFTLLLAGCSIAPQHESLKSQDLPDLIPVRSFVANLKSVSNYKISPDGKWIAWKGVSGLRVSVFVQKLGAKEKFVMNMHRQNRDFTWAADSKHLLVTDDTGGNENFHIYSYSIETPEAKGRDLTPGVRGNASVHRILPNDPEHILIAHNHRDKTVFDMYRLHIVTGKQDLLVRNPGNVKQLITDKDGRIRARIRYLEKEHLNKLDLYQESSQEWNEFIHWSEFETVYPFAFPGDGKTMLALSNREHDRLAVVKIDLNSGAETLVFSHPIVDTRSVLYSEKEGSLKAVMTVPDYPELLFYDKQMHEDFRNFFNKERVGADVLSRDREERIYTVAVYNYKLVRYFLYDRDKRKFTLLGSGPSRQFASQLADYVPFTIKARDGMQLYGYRTMPGTTGKKALPTVLLVHGGPWGRNSWGYRQLPQFLANRGYLVLEINYRGSRGYGRKYMEAAIGEFAGKMHDDLIDTVNWAIAKNLADPNRIAIMGRSYGGYATLVGMTKTPGVFRCGIDIVGPADLVSLVKDFPPYWKNWMHMWYRYAGNPDNPGDVKRMREKSPIHFAHQVKGPILIIQGENDPRVKRNQSDRMVEMLKKSGKQVEYMVIKGEGHGFRHWKNRLKMYRKTEDYLASCLGGRSSGFDFFELGSWMF